MMFLCVSHIIHVKDPSIYVYIHIYMYVYICTIYIVCIGQIHIQMFACLSKSISVYRYHYYTHNKGMRNKGGPRSRADRGQQKLQGKNLGQHFVLQKKLCTKNPRENNGQFCPSFTIKMPNKKLDSILSFLSYTKKKGTAFCPSFIHKKIGQHSVLLYTQEHRYNS